MKISEHERIIITNFLQWNDRNGAYTDELCKECNNEPFGKRDVLKFFFSTINQDLLYHEEDENPLNISLSKVVSLLKEKHLYFSSMIKLELLLKDDSITTYRRVLEL